MRIAFGLGAVAMTTDYTVQLPMAQSANIRHKFMPTDRSSSDYYDALVGNYTFGKYLCEETVGPNNNNGSSSSSSKSEPAKKDPLNHHRSANIRHKFMPSDRSSSDYYDALVGNYTFGQYHFAETVGLNNNNNDNSSSKSEPAKKDLVNHQRLSASTLSLNMPPPTHATHPSRLNNNNSNHAKTKNFNKRENWRNNRKERPKTPQGYDSDGSGKSQLSRDSPDEDQGKKSTVTFSYGPTFLYGHCDNNSSSVFFNTLPIQHPSHFSKIKNGGRQRKDHHKRHFPEEIVRRVHGLMERFTSRAKLFDIKPSHLSLRTGVPWNNLNEDIWNVFSMKAQKKDTYVQKLHLWSKVYLHIRNLMDRFGLFMVGSTMTGLGLENSDIDMCLLVRPSSGDSRSDAVNCLSLIREAIIHCDFAKDPQVIPAKVPILKFRGVGYEFQVDLNCNNAVGIRNTHLLHCYARLDWRVRPLVMIVKVWAQANRINDAKNMTISSYSLALMVIHFLQCGVSPSIVPCLHSLYPKKFDSEREIHDIDVQEEIPAFNSDNNQTLGELLIGFLEYYSYFRFDTYAISVRRGSHVLIDECRYARAQKNDPHQWKYLCIEEPFDLTNTARSVYDFETFKRIRRVFLYSYNVLRETENLNSILTNIEDTPTSTR